jgi:hypothetical protein
MLSLVHQSRAKRFYDYCQMGSSLGQGFDQGTSYSFAKWNSVEKDRIQGLSLLSQLSPVRFAGMLGFP